VIEIVRVLQRVIPAFFSCNVSSDQFTFIRSRRAIQSSACSCGGIASHLFSILASVGFEIACADANRCCVETHAAGRASKEELRGSARVTVLRSMLGVERYKGEIEGLKLRLSDLGRCVNGVSMGWVVGCN
jgi:hypothetical protein